MSTKRKIKRTADVTTARMLLGKYMEMVQLLAHYEMRIDALEARCALLEARSEDATSE